MLLVTNKSLAALTLTNLSQTYDGTARTVSCITAPPGLAVILTYEGSPNAPTNVGSYTVVATISDPDYEGTATDTLAVGKGAATVILGSLSQTYNGAGHSATATTIPSGLSVGFTYDGSTNGPTNATSYAVIGTVNDTNYQGSATGTLVIAKATALVVLSNLSQAYDGTAKSATATTTPPGLTVSLTYNGSANGPTNPGSYTVVGTVNDANYRGSATNILTIVLQLSGPTWGGSGEFQFTFSTAPGVTYTIQVSTDLRHWDSVLTFRGAGGPMTIIDPNATSGGQRFYRLRSP
jgi:hypothetical protein